MVKNTIIFSTILCSALICHTALGFETDAKHAILVDYNTDSVLFEKNADEQMHPSSMTKLMTTYIAFKKLRAGEITMDTEFPVSKKAWQTSGTKMFLQVDTNVSVKDLLSGIIVQSGNDACITLAEGISGDEATFATLMNKYAQELGLEKTNFLNSNGLSEPTHLMSSRDLAKLSKALISEFPEYFDLFKATEFTYSNITQPNRNVLIGELGVDGLKTGNTDAGGYGIAITAEQNGTRLIGVVNGLQSSNDRKDAAQKLLQYGFGNFEYKVLVPKGFEIATIPVWYGGSSNIQIKADKDYGLMLDKSKSIATDVKVKYSSPLIAPIKAGDKIAELILTDGNQEIHHDIAALEDVKKASWFGIAIQNMLNKLTGK